MSQPMYDKDFKVSGYGDKLTLDLDEVNALRHALIFTLLRSPNLSTEDRSALRKIDKLVEVLDTNWHVLREDKPVKIYAFRKDLS